MTVTTLKRKKWSIIGAAIGALLFPTLAFLLELTVNVLRVIIGS